MIDVGVGWAHSCALLEDGRVMCWGSNSIAQLGVSVATAESATPIYVERAARFSDLTVYHDLNLGVRDDGDLFFWGGDSSVVADQAQPVGLEGVSATAAGLYFGCAIVGQAVHCWGRVDDYRLGRPGSGFSSAPTPVIGLPPARLIAASFNDACIISEASELWCWGLNASGTIDPASPGVAQPPTRMRMARP